MSWTASLLYFLQMVIAAVCLRLGHPLATILPCMGAAFLIGDSICDRLNAIRDRLP